MGFDLPRVRAALVRFNNDETRAIEWLLEHPGDAADGGPSAPEPKSDPASGGVAELADLTSLLGEADPFPDATGLAAPTTPLLSASSGAAVSVVPSSTVSSTSVSTQSAPASLPSAPAKPKGRVIPLELQRLFTSISNISGFDYFFLLPFSFSEH